MTNAITRRVEHIQNIWDKFRNVPDARLCRWLVVQDERPMIETFYQVNAAGSSTTPDLFIRLQTPFLHLQTYGKALSEELHNIIETERAELAAEKMPLSWHSTHTDDPKNPTVGFLRNFFQLADSLDLDAFVVAYLAPTAIEGKANWEKWWAAATELNLPPKIRLMTLDTEGAEMLDKLAKQQPQKIMTFKPNLNMPDAMRELMNEFGDQNDKGTHFKKAFFELTQCVGKRDADGMKLYAEKAIGIARKMGYPHLEIAVLCTAANGFMTDGKLQTALKTYDEALRVAQTAKSQPLIKEMPDLKPQKGEDNIFEQLTIQILFSKGAAFVGTRPPQYQSGFEVYQQADAILKQMISAKEKPTGEVDFENGGLLLLHRLEALRMCGHCLEGLGQQQKALEIYAQAVKISENLTDDIRKGTTLNFIGQAMLTICKTLVLKQEYKLIADKMTVLLGEEWEKTLPKAA